MIRFVALAALIGCGAALAADTDAPNLTPIVAGETGGGKDSEPRATKFAPLAYFNQSCARCHGDYGSNYGDDFAKNLDDKALYQIVDEMADGPAQAPLSPADVETLTAWHRAKRDGKPFVVIVQTEKTDDGWRLSGEVSPGATLQINGENVEVKGSNWEHRVAAGAVKLCATKGDAVTELDASVGALAP